MSILTKGRNELTCYNNIGGIKKVYLFKYVNYAYSQIVGEKGVELTSFPVTTIHEYEIKGGSFNENIQNDENGILYNQELSFTLTKQDLATTIKLNTLRNIDLRYIVEFNDGSLKIGGLYNGAEINSLELVSGGSKSEFNGYRVSINSKERYQAAYINNLLSVGFEIYNEVNTYNFMDDNNFIFNDSNNYIFN